MVELNKKSLEASFRRETETLCSGDYDVDLQRMNKDIETMQQMLLDEEVTPQEKVELRKAIWTLNKWQMLEKIHVACRIENSKLLFKDRETECNGAKLLGVSVGKTGEKIRFAELTGNFNVRYLSPIDMKDSRLCVVDHSELADAVAFEYAINDLGIDAHALGVWTKDATIYTVNKGSIITEMVRTEMEADHAGRAFDLISSFRVNPVCARVQLSGDTILSYMGTKIAIDKDRKTWTDRRYYKAALLMSSDEIVCTLLGKAAQSGIKGRVKMVGYSDRMQIVLMVSNEVSDDELKDEFAAVARVLGRRYEFIPTIYTYNKDTDVIE